MMMICSELIVSGPGYVFAVSSQVGHTKSGYSQIDWIFILILLLSSSVTLVKFSNFSQPLSSSVT